MEIELVRTRAQRREFAGFLYRVYRDRPEFRDNPGHAVNDFLYGKGSFAKACRVRPVLVREGKNAVARCLFIAHPSLPALQIGFFEALPRHQGRGRDAVDLLLGYARGLAREWGLGRILIGINGHVVYGAGFLTDGFDSPHSFDSVYSMPCYPAYFSGRGFTEHTLTTWKIEPRLFAEDRAASRRAEEFTYRAINLREFKREIHILGDLFNKTLASTPFYGQRSIEESCELLRPMLPLLQDGNIIYALKDGREIGFILWHPDYNQAILNNKKQSVAGFYLRWLLRRRRISDLKINAWGVLPEYQRSGAAFGLLHEVYKRIQGRYVGGESGFVWDENTKSRLLCQSACAGECKHYVAYEWNLERCQGL